MKSDRSAKSLRRRVLLSSLVYCDSEAKKIDILIDIIIRLENNLSELQRQYTELTIKLCAHHPYI